MIEPVNTKIICSCGHEMKIISEADRRATYECGQCKISFWIPIKKASTKNRLFPPTRQCGCKIFEILNHFLKK